MAKLWLVEGKHQSACNRFGFRFKVCKLGRKVNRITVLSLHIYPLNDAEVDGSTKSFKPQVIACCGRDFWQKHQFFRHFST